MTALTFTLRTQPALDLDLSSLTPQTLAELSDNEIAALPLRQGNRSLRLDSLFEISGEDRQQLTLQAACPRLHNIGRGMSGGTLRVNGSVGAYCGRDLSGGELIVDGDCGPYAGCGMRGGMLRIHGNAGDRLGAPAPGDRIGISGGMILVSGNAGDRVGDRQRRGMILVEGNVGAYCGSRMIAGTIAVLGSVGVEAGSGMQRGTLLFTQEPPSLSATFTDNGARNLVFLPLLWQDFARLNSRFTGMQLGDRVRRYLGDRACGGMGEILVITG